MELHSNKFVNALMWLFIFIILWSLFSEMILKKSESTCGCKKKRFEQPGLAIKAPDGAKEKGFTSKEKACLAVGLCFSNVLPTELHKWKEQIINDADIIFFEKKDDAKPAKKKKNGRRK